LYQLFFLLNYLGPTDQRTPRLKAGFEKGQHLAPIPGISYGKAPRTLLIALNTNCGFCTESVPFYNRLAEAQRVGNSLIRIVAVFPNSEKEVQQYPHLHGLALSSKAAVDLRSLNVVGTPTMLLLDQNGNIVDFWLGKPTEAVQNQIMTHVKS
jgi:hypothetical protein